MSDWWDSIKSWFTKLENSSPTQPYIHEMIERTEKDQINFEQWQKSADKEELIAWVLKSYQLHLHLPERLEKSIDFLDTPSSKGFVIHCKRRELPSLQYQHFLDYLKNKVKELGYKVYMSDAKTFNLNNKVETVQRHYLKPRISFSDQQKVDQRYGNVTIELMLNNDIPYRMKFQVSGYVDHKFEKQLEFGDLLRTILE